VWDCGSVTFTRVSVIICTVVSTAHFEFWILLIVSQIPRKKTVHRFNFPLHAGLCEQWSMIKSCLIFFCLPHNIVLRSRPWDDNSWAGDILRKCPHNEAMGGSKSIEQGKGRSQAQVQLQVKSHLLPDPAGEPFRSINYAQGLPTRGQEVGLSWQLIHT
jgi:hypothetical protein